MRNSKCWKTYTPARVVLSYMLGYVFEIRIHSYKSLKIKVEEKWQSRRNKEHYQSYAPSPLVDQYKDFVAGSIVSSEASDGEC